MATDKKVFHHFIHKTGNHSGKGQAYRNIDGAGKGDFRSIGQGDWVTSTAYIIDDVVQNDGSSYICKSDHTSAAADEPGVGVNWTTYWTLFASKGDQGDQGQQGIQGPTGCQGPAGNDGAVGSVWHNGSGVPGAGLGADGDYYLNDDNGDYYKKVTGSWVLQDNLKGDTGATGPAGSSDLPIGTIVQYITTLGGKSNTNDFGDDWQLCDGSDIDDAKSFFYQNPTRIQTPDLAGKYLKGTDTGTGGTGGNLTHTHNLNVTACAFCASAGTNFFYLNSSGGDVTQSTNHEPPYYEVQFWLKHK